MLTVTEAALNRFRSTLNGFAPDSRALVRMVPSPEDDNKLEFILEEEQEGDQIVETQDGKRVLAVEQELAQKLEGMILDYHDKPEGKGFAVYRIASDS